MEEFKERIFGTPYMIWHDGVPDCTHELSLENPAIVRKMIIAGLDEGDYVAVEALRMVDWPELLPDLVKRLKKAIGRFRIELAITLQEKVPPPDDRYAKEVINEIMHPQWMMRIDAAIFLRHFPVEYTGEVLLKKVAEDPDYLVRYHCAESYLKGRNIQPSEVFAHEDVFHLICPPVDEKSTALDYECYKKAAEKLRALKSSNA